MLRALANSAAGINAQAQKVDVIAHNIANINTVGYKKQDVSFAELLHRELAAPGVPVNPQPPSQRPVTGGHGVTVNSMHRDWREGAVVETGRTLDFAIIGQGFFEVVLPNGNLAYTRSGVFHVDPEGYLVTAQGYPLTVPFVIDPDIQEITVSPEGIVTGKNAAGETAEIGYWPIYSFVNPEGLEAVGDNLYIATEASGEAWEGMPGEENLGTIKQGYLESSNVTLAEEITSLIEAQRAYQINSRALQAADEMWSMANNLRR
ncbi:MAG TPA: flagellar basal-body rod protein FlgG [Clostridia bacterium]|nr:flagellar basal-body rod protein FlgG [Clostridia bacterium]